MSSTTPVRAHLARAVLALAAVVAGTVATAPLALADEAAWSIAPADNEHGDGRANYGYVLAPGEIVQDALDVTNTGDVELVLDVAAADGFTTATGVLDLRPLTEQQVDVGAWVVTDVTELVLAPGERVEVPFTLTVPPDAAAGDHTGGVVTVRTAEGGATVQLQQRLGSRIHVRVPGEQTVALTLGTVEVGQPVSALPWRTSTVVLTYRVANTGNVRTLADERITVTGPGGIATLRQAGDVAEILPGGEVVRRVEVPGVWALGRTEVRVELVPQAVAGEVGAAVEAEGRAWAVPWSLLAALVLLVTAAVVVGVRRARDRPGPAPVQVP